jgi:hypothetical protein
MDNEQLTEMSDADFTAAVKRLQSYAENRADQAFKSGDRKRFELWDTRATTLKHITSLEELLAMSERLIS